MSPAAEPVTVTVARRVAPGREADFASWCEAVTAAASTYPGHLGAGVLRPSRLGEPWHLVFRFASDADLRRWDLVHSTDVHRVSGLETWFALPGRTAPAPPRWKMFAVSVVAIYALQLLLHAAVDPAGLPAPLRVLVVAVAVTALMTWFVMPRAARLLQGWLYRPPR
jgi:antibiotic biosynthesis monooxygenase (ABM) superfamily enzyme